MTHALITRLDGRPVHIHRVPTGVGGTFVWMGEFRDQVERHQAADRRQADTLPASWHVVLDDDGVAGLAHLLATMPERALA